MFINFYTDAETAAYEKAIAWKAAAAMRGKPPETGPLAARVYAMMPIPKSWPNRDKEAALAGIKFPMSASDCDNIAKSIFDGCNGIIYADDKQIVQMLVHKEYAENPGIIAEFFKLA